MSHSRLFSKALIFMLLAFGALALVTSGYSAWLLKSRLTNEHTEHALAIAQSIANPDATLQENSTTFPSQNRLKKYTDIDGISYIIITDNAGTIEAQSFDGFIPTAVRTAISESTGRTSLFSQNIDASGTGPILHVSSPVRGADGKIVHIGMDRSHIEDAIKDALQNLQLLTVSVFAMCALATWFFMRNITRPLRVLADSARNIAAHDFSVHIDTSANDEVGEVARAVKSTAQELSGVINTLQKNIADGAQELQDTQSTFRAIMDNMADGLIVSNAGGDILEHNAALLDMFLITKQDVMGRNIRHILQRDIEDIVRRTGLDIKALTSSSRLEARSGKAEINTMLGDLEFPVEISVTVAEQAECRSFIFIIRDITERKFVEEQLLESRNRLETRVRERTAELEHANAKLKDEILEREIAERALREAEADYRSIFENAVEGIFRMAPNGTLTDCNPAMARIFGFSSPRGLLENFSTHGSLLIEKDETPFVTVLMTNQEVMNYQTQAKRGDGRNIWVSINARCVLNETGETQHFEGSVEDITRRKEYEAQLEHQAFHDPLTSLPNRSLFLNHLEMAIRRKKRTPNSLFAVLYLDLDRFKVVNDSLGHNVGDLLLQHVAAVLTSCVRDVDTVARFGGDEFAILLDSVNAPRESIKISKRILRRISRPAKLNGCEVFTAASIGIVFMSEDYEDADAILRDADTAMYHAKEQGKGRFKVFNHKMHDQAIRQLKMETDLRLSIDEGCFTMHYQPIVDLPDGKLSGFEALIRWQHPKLGVVYPDEFIPLAEDTGLILPLGSWTLREVCRQVRIWYEDYALSVPISINISARQFMLPTLLSEVQDILHETKAPPHLLKFEITETVLMQNAPFAIDTLSKLREMGILISMDDFGTGYSLFSYLVEFPIDVIKIDKSLVSRVTTDKDCSTIVRSIVGLTHNLGFNAVAEGVEDAGQADMLKTFNCPCAQGYYYSRPMPAEAVVSFLEKVPTPVAN